MSNPTFSTAVPDTLPPDPSKHVNYTQGMVLGVDDFQQEFAYLSNRDQWLARDAIGYGTVCGLHVSLDPADPNRISVSPGVAINPRGQLIRVTPRQCAQIDAWLGLQTTIERMNKLGLGTSGDFTAYVVLCYRDCPVDELPVPGEPCRCDSDTMAASRIIDDFRLELTLEAPPQTEEDIVRDFVTWLRGVEIADFIPVAGELEAFLQAIRDAFGCADSPPQSPPEFVFDSPPAGLRIPHDLLCEWMRAALRLWVTELRSCWQAQCAPKKSCACGGPCGCHGTGAQPDDMACDCLLLAAVRISRGGGGNITSVKLDEERRPYLVHLRMLQELLLCGPCCGDSCGDSRTFATVIALDEDTLQIWVHHPLQLSLPDAAVVLTLGGVPITDFTISPTGPNLFELTLASSPPQLMGNAITIDLEFDANLILEPDGRPLATAIWQERYCYNDYVEPHLHVFAATGTLALAGDVVGPPGSNRLAAIQGEPLNLTGLGNKQALGHDNNEWHPVPMPQPATMGLPEPETFGVAGSLGSNAGNNPQIYARADHRHSMPPNPVPPHDINASAHRNLRLGAVAPPIAIPALSDVRGNAENNVVVGLQTVPVSNTALGPAQNGFVLTYRSGPKQWVAEKSAAGSPFRVTSGLVIFKDVKPGETRFSPDIPHGFEKELVMIRLGVEQANGPKHPDLGFVEDVDSFFRALVKMAVYVNGSTHFYITIRDGRGGPGEQAPVATWSIRWWAVPVTQLFDKPIEVPAPPEQSVMQDEIILGMALWGAPVPELASKLQVTEAKVQPVVDKLKTEGAVRVVKGRILPPA